MTDNPEIGRAVFNIGAAFPADDRVAPFMVAVSLAWNDLMLVNLRLIGGDEHGPGKHEVSNRELRYLVRIAFAHLQELRQCISYARSEWTEVDAFLAALPATTQADLDVIMNLNTAEDDWIEDALRHLRHQTFHYGATSNWKALRWAMRAAADQEGEIVRVNASMAGTSLEFADLISLQHLIRKFPENAGGGPADIDEAVIEERFRTLVSAVTSAVTAAMRFALDALIAYLNTLPDDVVEIEH